MDKSPTKEARQESWLWTFVTRTYRVFTLRTTWAATVLEELFPDTFAGVVNCYRAKINSRIGRPQWCSAHLKRDFQALIDHPDHQVKRLVRDLMRLKQKFSRHWAHSRDGTIARHGFERLRQPIRRKIDALLLRGVFSGNKKLREMC